MGLLVNVLRHASGWDCTNNGISSRVDTLCITNIEGPFEPRTGIPGVILESHVPGCLRIVPADAGNAWVMFGGNYAACSDSRFREACEGLLGHSFYGAVAIHDRIE